MRAMILAAGMGTRLKPLTNNKPKALVEINGKAMIAHVIDRLTSAGVTDIIVNVHHQADQLVSYLDKNLFDADIVVSDETDMLLDTGGALKKAEWFLKGPEPFIVHNVDVLSDINLEELMSYHIQNESLVTLAVRSRHSSRYLLFDNHHQLIGWENVKTHEMKLVKPKKGEVHSYGFSGIQVIDPEIFHLITEVGAFSLIDLYLRLAKSYHIHSYIHDYSLWNDLGTPENLIEAEKTFF